MKEILQFLYSFSAFLRHDSDVHKYCVNEIHSIIISGGPSWDLSRDEVIMEMGFNFSMITDPADPLYEDEPRELCYYAPITMSYTGEGKETVRDMHRDYLDPIIVSI